MNSKKVIKTAAKGTFLTAGYALQLAKWGLNASEVVLNGAANLAGEFVKSSSLGIGKALLDGIKQQTGKLAKKLISQGKSM